MPRRPVLTLPAAATAAFFVLLGALIALKMCARVDPDLFYHLKDGERVLTEARFPVTEDYSYTAAGRPMVAHEWLSSVLFYLVFRLAGYGGLVVFCTTLFLLTLWALRRLLGDEPTPASRLFLLSLAAFVFVNFYAARAQVFTFLLTALFLLWARLWEEGWRWAPWAMAGSLLLWVNLHGGFMIGWVLLALVCALQALQTRRAAELAPLALGTLLCFVHPNGATAFVYPVWFLFAAPPGRGLIKEWMPVDFGRMDAAPYALLIALLAWSGVEKVRRRFPWAPLTLALLVLSLRARKMIPEFALAAVAALGFRIKDIAPPRRAGRLFAAGTLALLGAIAEIAAGPARGLAWPCPAAAWERGYPKAAAELIGRRYAGLRIFHPYDWGAYLIFKLAPRTKVFIDGRLEPYWQLLQGDYKTVVDGAPGWAAVLDSYGVQLVLLPAHTSLAQRVGQDGRWKQVYEDSQAVVFIRAGTLPGGRK